ncbi:MAG: ABC transporter ATP-binding protein [Microbacteriaceae bacterium]|nr:ABC transporter ATP-binding protein [Microbacteriaceae bacterium]
MEMMPAIQITALTKQFADKKVAVDNLNMTVPTGTMFGFVGPNGAGKTTTISMISGLLRPTAGSVAVLGQDVWSDPIASKARLGVLPERDQLFERLSGFEHLRYTGLLRGLAEADTVRRAEELLEALELTADKNKPIADYSTGMAKKIGLATALIHAPRVLLLDEPFEAVDPVSAARIRDILKAYVADGGTVVFSSHVMELVERLCDHVAVINKGALVAAGTLAEVSNGQSLQDRFLHLVGSGELAEGSLSWLHA